MRYFSVEPEVAGGLGPHTMMDRSVHPPIVSSLHYQFEGWLGDQIVESFPCVLVTETLSTQLLAGGFSGFDIGKVEVSVSEQFHDACPHTELPPFVWLRVVGIAGTDDFGVGPDARLVVSERALRVIRATDPQALDVELFVG